MSIQYPPYIWQNGEMKAWADGTTHVMAHALHYGSSVFEGIRAYATPDGPRILKLTEHLERLYVSARMYDMKIGYSMSELRNACFDLLEKNQLGSAYLRPIAFRGLGAFGLGADNPVEVAIGAWEWGPYLGAEAVKQGVSACVSSWRRLAPNTIPTLAKAGGNYLSSTLISLEARERGFAEGIALSTSGTVSEGAGENLFLIRDGSIITPSTTDSVLQGITRDAVMTLAHDLGIPIREQGIPREMLYVADEIFLTGTAAEITPVRSVDRITVGSGVRGPVTTALQNAFFGLFNGRTADKWGWLESLA